MPSASSSGQPIDVLLAENMKVTRLSMPSAGTEYSHVLQSPCKGLELELLDDHTAKFSFSFTATESGTGKLIPKTGGFYKDWLKLTNKTLYVQSDKAAQTLVITEFY